MRAVLEMSTNFSQVWREGGAWADQVEVTFVVVDCAVLLVTFLLGSAANVFVVHAVRRHKSLQTATNALLVNLALVDLLRCATDCPLLMMIVLRARGRADLGLALCSAQLTSFSLNCSAQLLTVVGISVERHRAVTKPFESGGGGGDRRKRVTAWIPFTWAAPALASALCARYARDSPVYSKCRGIRGHELRSFDSFGRYVLLPAWCVCLAVIATCYAHIFIVVRAQSRKIFDKGMFPPPKMKKGLKKEEKTSGTKENVGVTHEMDKTNLVSKNNGVVQTVLPDSGAGDAQTSNESPAPTPQTQGSVTLVSEPRENAPELTNVGGGEEQTLASPALIDNQSAFETRLNAPELIDVEGGDEHAAPERASPASKGTQSASETHQNEPSPEVLSVSAAAHDSARQEAQQDVHPGLQRDAQVEKDQSAPQNAPESEPQNAPESEPQNAPESEPQNAQESAPQVEEVVGEVCMMPSFANRDRGNKKKESKLAKRSGYIIFTFLIFWLPLIGTTVMNVFLDRAKTPGKNIVQELEVLAVCIACMTSLTNPIIYAAVNPQFRNEFYYLKKKCKALCAKR
ncbi:hypothetical protein NFI96_018434 [Prochilodus magdalenae]|nr:hypothetical protein NFI96_018434 [Prochilodus magdalenae]